MFAAVVWHQFGNAWVPNILPVASFTASPNPVADATSAVTLTDTSTDADGTIVSRFWEMVSGPSGGTFDSTTASSATFTPGSPSYVAEVLADAPDRYWRFEETTGDPVEQIGSTTGTWTGADFDLAVAGRIDSGVSIGLVTPGTYYTVAPFIGASALEPLTVEFWFKSSTNTGNRAVYSEALSSVAGRYWNVSTATDKLAVVVRNADTPTFRTSTATVVDGSWHHCVVVIGADHSNTFYIDGVLDSAQAHRTQSTTSFNAAAIGAIPRSTPADFISGSVDELALYRKELSPTRIAAHYAARGE